MGRNDTFVPALGQEYEFRDGKMIFPDGVEYSLAEALTMAKDLSLTDRDIQAIHAVKKLFDGRIVDLTTPAGTVTAWIPPGSLNLGDAPEAVELPETRSGDFLDDLASKLAGGDS